jgi:hypothetical protein
MSFSCLKLLAENFLVSDFFQDQLRDGDIVKVDIGKVVCEGMVWL